MFDYAIHKTKIVKENRIPSNTAKLFMVIEELENINLIKAE